MFLKTKNTKKYISVIPNSLSANSRRTKFGIAAKSALVGNGERGSDVAERSKSVKAGATFCKNAAMSEKISGRGILFPARPSRVSCFGELWRVNSGCVAAAFSADQVGLV
jgi:hypothetical protein